MGKKHPLDIFRTSDSGFESASRQRRTLPGRVVASTPRTSAAADRGSGSGPRTAPERSPPLISAARAAAAVRSEARSDALRGHSTQASAAAPARPSARDRDRDRDRDRRAGERSAGGTSAPRGARRILMYSALVMVAVLAVYVAGASQVGGTALKSQTVLSTGAAAGGGFAILAASWDGTAAGRAAAVSSQAALRERGFDDVTVLGYPGAEAGTFRSFDLLVGAGSGRAGLEPVLARLLAIKSGKGGSAPFGEARIVPMPTTKSP